MFNEAEP